MFVTADRRPAAGRFSCAIVLPAVRPPRRVWYAQQCVMQLSAVAQSLFFTDHKFCATHWRSDLFRVASHLNKLPTFCVIVLWIPPRFTQKSIFPDSAGWPCPGQGGSHEPPRYDVIEGQGKPGGSTSDKIRTE